MFVQRFCHSVEIYILLHTTTQGASMLNRIVTDADMMFKTSRDSLARVARHRCFE